MRIVFGLAIAIGLSFTASGIAFCQQPPPDSAADSPQPPSTEKTASQDVAAKKTTANSAHAVPTTTKRSQRSTPAPPGGPRKIVVPHAGASEPAEQIVPGMTPSEAARQRQTAESWLGSTDAQLKQLAERQLNSQQQETMGQIRNYLTGARGALQEGDVRRASTLAEKAHLLADDLVRH